MQQEGGHGRRRQAGSLGEAPGERPRGDRAKVWLLVAQDLQHPVASRWRAEPPERIDGVEPRRDAGVVHEREQAGHRRIAPQPPGLREDPLEGRRAVLLRQRHLASEHAAEELAAPGSSDLGERRDGLGGGHGVERGETGQTVDERLHCGGVPQQAECERGRHPDGGVAVGEERQHERRGAQIADPPRPEHGDSAYQ